MMMMRVCGWPAGGMALFPCQITSKEEAVLRCCCCCNAITNNVTPRPRRIE